MMYFILALALRPVIRGTHRYFKNVVGDGVNDDTGVAEILCFNLDEDQDLYYEVDSKNVKLNSGKPLPTNWSSRESNSMKVGSGY